MAEGESYSPHSGTVSGRSPGVDGYMLAEAEFPPGQFVALYVGKIEAPIRALCYPGATPRFRMARTKTPRLG